MIWRRRQRRAGLTLCAPAKGSPFPLHTDWAWRPDVFGTPLVPPRRALTDPRTPLSGEASVFHDGPSAEAVLIQTATDEPGRFALQIDIARIEASYLSLAVDLPDEAARSIAANHILRVETDLRRGGIGSIWVRLNIVRGPNARQGVSEVPVSQGGQAEFDMAEIEPGSPPPERAWLDLIFGNPGPGRFAVSDLVISRRPRAGF